MTQSGVPPVICEICSQTFDKEDLKTKATVHFLGKTHQRRMFQSDYKKPAIFLPDTKGLGLFDVMEYFVTFGQIIMLQPFLERNDDKADKELIRIRIFYEDQETIDKILKIQRHVIVSRPTRVVKSRPPKDRPEQKFIPKEEIQTAVIKVSKEEVENELKDISDKEEQMSRLKDILELTQEDYDERAKIARYIQSSINELYPNCIVYLFGSTVNGLGFKGCDIDAFMDLGICEGRTTTSIDRGQQKNACQKITAFLRSAKNQKYIANVTGVPAARVPIVKFIHIKTALSVDLSFRNPMAVLNTDFIRLCVEADSRIRIVMISIRYWASRNGLSGGGSRGWKFTNYALSMLIIFYLQTEGILPTAQFLIENLQPEESAIIDGWECGFSHDLSKWKQSLNKKSPLELLKGFFEYYANFDYENSVISPYAGMPIDKKEFLAGKTKTELPILKSYWDRIVNDDLDVLPTNSPVCIQDPFELNFCITKGYYPGAFEVWKSSLSLTLERLSSEDAPSSGLLAIFELPPIAKPENKKDRKIREKIEAKRENGSSGPHFRFALVASGKKADLNQCIMQIFKDIMLKVFKMKVSEYTSEKGHAKIIRDCPDNEKCEDNIVKSLICSSSVPLWDHRKVAKTELKMNPSDPSIENEKQVSDFIFNKFCSGLIDYSKLPPDAVFDLSFHWIQNDSYCVHLKTLQSRKKLAGRILGFLHEFLPEVIEYELKNTNAYREGNKD